MYLCEYGAAAMLGLLFGIIISMPVSKMVSANAVTSLGIIVPAEISLPFAAIFTAVWIVIISIIIVLPCRRLDRITPVSAILDRENSRQTVSKHTLDLKRLTISLAVRELLSSKRHYIAVCLIAAFLTVFGGIVLDMNGWLGKNGCSHECCRGYYRTV
nr:hypothetical protein [Ruminococcus sp. NK3A76]